MQRHANFWALREVSFHLERGECLGIIGPNGAGKTTLLKILSRALYPTAGNFEVRGRTVSLLELGTGFNLQLTGTQNIFTSARLLGFTDEYVKSRLEAIVEFSELGEFMDRPIQIYSTGMYLRLAFSLFACLEPDVYIIDEALAVGDASFQKKCMDKINEMRQEGVTILFVSHDLWRVEALCNRAIYLNHGLIQSSDSPDVVIKHYLDDQETQAAQETNSCSEEEAPALGNSASDGRPKAVIPQFEMYAESPLKVRRLWICDEHQKMKSEFQSEEDFEVVLEYDCTEAIRQPIFRVVFALPDERRVSVVSWHPGEGDLEPGTGLIRWRVNGGFSWDRRVSESAAWVNSWLVTHAILQISGKIVSDPKHGTQVLGLNEQVANTIVGVVDHPIPGRDRGMKDVFAGIENSSIDSPADQPCSRFKITFTRVPAHHRDSPFIGQGEEEISKGSPKAKRSAPLSLAATRSSAQVRL